ncbi:unnamed protein product [marine sediment metagenome]|uniref:Uncharacterized protein n=1 Tax=marine sediment metagenome TaxID=412755 RepID=X1TUY0_9ZZZZ
MPKCKLCNQDVENIIKHGWEAHPDEMRERARRGREKALLARQQKAKGVKDDTGKREPAKNPLDAVSLAAILKEYKFPLTPKMVAGYQTVLARDRDISFSEFIDMLIDDVFESRGLKVFEEAENVKAG